MNKYYTQKKNIYYQQITTNHMWVFRSSYCSSLLFIDDLTIILHWLAM